YNSNFKVTVLYLIYLYYQFNEYLIRPDIPDTERYQRMVEGFPGNWKQRGGIANKFDPNIYIMYVPWSLFCGASNVFWYPPGNIKSLFDAITATGDLVSTQMLQTSSS